MVNADADRAVATYHVLCKSQILAPIAPSSRLVDAGMRHGAPGWPLWGEPLDRLDCG